VTHRGAGYSGASSSGKEVLHRPGASPVFHHEWEVLSAGSDAYGVTIPSNSSNEVSWDQGHVSCDCLVARHSPKRMR